MPRPYVVRALDHDPRATSATMTQRRPAITSGTVGAEQICMAYGVSGPGTSTGAHHHADTETAAYVLSFADLDVVLGEMVEALIPVGGESPFNAALAATVITAVR